MLKDIRALDRRLWILAAARLVVTAGLSMVMPLLGMHLAVERGFSAVAVGSVWTISGLIGAGSQWLAGELADRVGRRPLMLAALVLRAVNLLAIGWAVHARAPLFTFGVLVTANAVLRSLFDPVCSAAVADLCPADRRVAAFSLQRVGINVGWSLGLAIPSAVHLLGVDLAYDTFFFASVPFNLIAAVAIATLPESATLRPPRGRARLAETLAFLRDRTFVRFLAGTLAHFLLQVQLYLTMPIFAGRTLGLARAEVAPAFLLNGIIVVFLQIPAAAAIDRIGTRRALMWGALGYAAAYASMGAVHGLGGLLACVALLTLSEIVISPAQQATATTLAPQGYVGAYAGLYGLAQVVGQSVGPLLGTGLLDALPERLPWPLLGTLGVVAALTYRGVAKSP